MECMLNWLFSSFTYLPNFIIWLPSFSSPWLVQLASKCHCAFVRFLDFFHTVKKVSKPSNFCEIICVSKRKLVILVKMLYYTAFFKAKHFVILFFFFICMIYKWGGDSIGSNFPRGKFSWGKNSWGNFHRGELSKGAIFLIPILGLSVIIKWNFVYISRKTYVTLFLVGVLETLIQSKRLSGAIQGHQEKAVYIPNIYSNTQTEYIDTFFDQNGYIGR